MFILQKPQQTSDSGEKMHNTYSVQEDLADAIYLVYYRLCLTEGAVNTQGFVWKFLCVIITY